MLDHTDFPAILYIEYRNQGEEPAFVPILYNALFVICTHKIVKNKICLN